MTDDVRRLVELRAEKDRLEEALKPVTTEIEAVTARILDRWSEDGIDSMRVDGKHVVLSRRVWARVIDRARVAEVLRAAGLDALLTPNAQSLSAYVKEMEENDQPLPPGFEGVIDRFEKYSLSVRNGRS